MLLYLNCQFWTTSFHDATLVKYMYKLRLDHLEQAIVVSDYDT